MYQKTKNKGICFLLLILTIFLFGFSNKQDNSVYRIELHTENGYIYFCGTAIECKKVDKSKYEITFLTAKHCIEGFEYPGVKEIKFHNNYDKNLILDIKNVSEIKKRKDRDIGSFKIIFPYKVKTIKVSDYPYYQKGEKIQLLSRLVLGHYTYIDNGIITEIDNEENICMTNIFVRPGISGSPVLNKRNEIIGIVSFQEYFKSKDKAEWRPMGFAKIK